METLNNDEIIEGYKGFDKNLQCNDFQYEIGKTYEYENEISLCKTGFHFCENPLDVLNYYPLIEGNRYCKVTGQGKYEKSTNDSKVVVEKIEIEKELTLQELIKKGIEYISKETEIIKKENSATSGDYSHSATFDNNSHSVTSSNYSHSATSGYNSHSATSGYNSHSVTSGNYSNSVTSGDFSHSAISGEHSHSITSGDYSNSATSGDNSYSVTSGNNSNSATSGNFSNSITYGNNSHSVTAGDDSNSITHGEYSHSVTVGEYSYSKVNGKESIAAGFGKNNKVKGELGSWLVLSEWKQDDNDNWHVTSIKSAIVDGKKIKPNIWYKLENGEFVEV